MTNIAEPPVTSEDEAVSLETIRRAVLEIVSARPSLPLRDVLAALSEQGTRATDQQVADVLVHLLTVGQLIMTPQRELKVA